MENTTEQYGFLIDSTKCVGCRACQVSCKQWNNLPAEKTVFFGGEGYQNPKNLSENTFTLVRYHEVVDERGEIKDWVFWKDQCQHCNSPSCASACLVGAIHKTKSGPVLWDESKCIGCRYCMLACPYNIPKFQWNEVMADIRKCSFCSDRIEVGLEPSCAKACPTGAILFGYRDELIEIAEKRLHDEPDRYYQHIYGIEEVGGTNVLNIASVPLEKLGYPANLPLKPLPGYTAPAMHAVSPVVVGLGLLLGATAFISNRKKKIKELVNDDKHE
jgi:formate dehydrogenase iron-sulfur subunit